MKTIIIKTQEELDALPKEFDEFTAIEIRSDGVYIKVQSAYNSASVSAYDNARVYAYDNAKVSVYNDAEVSAYDYARVYAYDYAKVSAYNSASVSAYDNAKVYAYNDAKVDAYDNAKVSAYDYARVSAYNSASVSAYNDAIVDVYNSARVYAYGNAKVSAYDYARVSAYNSASVSAYDYARVYAYDYAKVSVYNDAIVSAYDNASVYAYDYAKVYAYNDAIVDAFMLSNVFVFSMLVKVKHLADNARLIYKTQNCQRPEKQDTTAVITELSDIVTPTFDQWLERGIVYADGICQKLVSQKTIGETTIYETDQGFVARIGDRFAHGKTIEQAKNDLRYKLSDRDTSKFKSWKLDDVKPTDELIECYMAVTGACSFGTKQFCLSIKLKDEYTISEIVELTKNRYGNEQFSAFFKGKK